MKKIILSLLIVLFTLSSCSDDYKIKKQFKSHMKEILSDPNSYEFIKIETLINREKIKNDSLDQVYLFDKTDGVPMHKKFDKLVEKREYLIGQDVKNAIITYRAKNNYGMNILKKALVRIDDKGEIHQIDNTTISKIGGEYYYNKIN
jgi:hypothetical protein